MRFDGYFILSDLLDFPNLHERSGALARTWLRRLVLGLTDDWPENLPRHQHHLLIAFALATWLYRLVVFLGIAWMVYAFFFKALGIFLMLVEIVWFVARPVWQEAIMWWRRWPEVSSGRRRRLYAMAGLFGLLVLLPWRLSVPALGVAHVERQQRVFTPFPARLVQLHPAGKVAAGTSLALFETPDLTAREVQARAGAEALERTLTGLLAKTEGIAQQSALTQRMDERLAEIRATREEIGRLRIAAEFAGEWRDVSDQLHPGSWVGIKEPLGVLIDPHSWVVDAYVEQRLIERVEPGATATFLAEGGLHRIPAVVVDIDRTRTQRLPYAMLDSRHGGPILTRPEGQGSVPVDALYHVRLRLIEFPGDVQEWRGSLQIEGQARSLVWLWCVRADFEGLQSAFSCPSCRFRVMGHRAIGAAMLWASVKEVPGRADQIKCSRYTRYIHVDGRDEAPVKSFIINMYVNSLPALLFLLRMRVCRQERAGVWLMPVFR